MNASELQFAADRMLGRLAKLLRLLGYDTLYAPDVTPPQLLEIARTTERMVLTRGDSRKRFPGISRVYSLEAEHPPAQLREVVAYFGLDARSALWTRCTLCNSPIAAVPKGAIEARLDPKIFHLYEQFFRCTGCGHIYWRGSHVERILRNLEKLLAPPPG